MTPVDFYNIPLDCIDKHAESLLNKNKTALIYVPSSFPSPLEGEGARRAGEGDNVVKLTFSNLQGLTNRIANALKKLEINPGERLILRLPNCPEFPITFLGAIKAGVIPIPTSPLLTWNELKFILEDSEASVLVTTEELLPSELFESCSLFVKRIIILSPSPPPSPAQGEGEKTLPASRFTLHNWKDLLKSSSPSFKTEPTPANAPAYWLYTSGTEGEPKAVIHAHRSIRAHDSRAKVWQDLKQGDVVFNTSSLNWSYALTCGMLDLWRHGVTSLIYSGDLSPEKICGIVKHFGVTTFMSVPGIYRRLSEYLKLTDESFSKVRACLSAGEKLSEEIRDRFREATGLEIYEGLGMTEHSVYLVQRFSEPIVKGSCGKPLPQHQIAILRENLSEASPGEIGILASHQSCPGLLLGYYKRPDEEKEVFRKNWFLSGDLAYQDEQENFYFVGRRDDVITAGGYRISPHEVEAVINQCSLVAESAVVGKEIEPGKTIVVAFVVLNAEAKGSEKIKEKIRSDSSQKLAKYKVPREIIFVKALPKTQNGKIKRKELKI
jgi:acetyl-CoA synthetase